KPGKMKLKDVLAKLIDNPREILNLEVPKIEEGAPANLTLFNTDREWTFEKKHIKSKSKNSPYVGSQMVGKAEAIYNNGQFIIND
ncbi:MAG TPA: hypothetical protein VJ905_13330, partial [Halalkalibaculum sp.]|nr:hypothetical protein [Halalkalibaculum sp.]